MHRTSSIALLTHLLLLLTAPPAGAVTADNITGLSTHVVFGIASLVGVILALILVHVANEGRQAKRKIIASHAKPGEIDPNEILNELLDLSGSKSKQKKAVMAISSLLDEKVDEKVTMVKQELAEKYGKLVDEKSKLAAEAQKKFKKTLAEKKTTEAIVRSVAAGVVVVNNKGEVLLMNPAAEKLLNTTRDQKIGHPLTEGTTDQQLISMAKSTSLDGETDIEIDGKEDTKKILRSSSAVIEDENGQMTTYIEAEDFFGYRIPWKHVIVNPESVDSPNDSRWIAHEILRPLEDVKENKRYKHTQDLQGSPVADGRLVKSSSKNRKDFNDTETLEIKRFFSSIPEDFTVFGLGTYPHIYYLLDKIPPGNVFVFQFPWFMKIAESKILKGVEDFPPDYVIRNESATVGGYKLIEYMQNINSYVDSNYLLVTRIGDNEILKKL